jgi:hypothetical protein
LRKKIDSFFLKFLSAGYCGLLMAANRSFHPASFKSVAGSLIIKDCFGDQGAVWGRYFIQYFSSDNRKNPGADV